MADYNTNNPHHFQFPQPPPLAPPPSPPPPLHPPQHPPQPTRSGKAAMAFARFTQPFGIGGIGGIGGSRPPSSSGAGGGGIPGGNAPRSTSATVNANTRLTSRTTELGLDSPIQAISANQECDRLVVAGRDFLKIITSTEDVLAESTQTLRAHSNRRGFIQNEVKWGNNPARDLIATAATNGSIALYRDFRHDRILQEHHRQVNRLAFNAADGRLLLSASQDGSVKMWDLREKKSRITFVGKSEAVRDVQFNEANAVEFVAGYENGSVQRWDYRNPNVCERKISNAHQGPVYSVAWHPDGKHCASGGRDKTVKVWDFYADPRRKSKHTVFTQTSLGRVVWRPGGVRTTELATCSIGNDYRIHGWDLRRPYMPTWVLMEHGNAITGLEFKGEDILWSGGKDCLLVQHDVCFGHAPIGDLPLVAFAWNSENEFTFAAQRRKRNETTGGPRGGSGGSGGGRSSGMRVHLDPDDYHVRSGSSSAPEDSRSKKKDSRSPSFRRDPKSVQQPSALDSPLIKFQPAQATARVNLPVFNFDKFDFLAKHYITTLHDERGFTIGKACERNARAAYYVGEYRTAKTWQVLGYLLTREDEARAEKAEQERLRKAQEQAYNALPGGGAIVARRLLGLGGEKYALNPGSTPMQKPVPDTPKPTPMPTPIQGENVINIDEALLLPPAAFGSAQGRGGAGSTSAPSSTASTDGDSSPRILNDEEEEEEAGVGEEERGGYATGAETGTEAGEGSQLATSPRPILSVDTCAHNNSHNSHRFNPNQYRTRNNAYNLQRRDSTSSHPDQQHPPSFDSESAAFFSTSAETGDVLSSLEPDRDPNAPPSEGGSYEQPVVIRTRPRQYSIGLMSEQTSGSYEEHMLGLGSEREDNGVAEGEGGGGRGAGTGLHAIMEEGGGWYNGGGGGYGMHYDGGAGRNGNGVGGGQSFLPHAPPHPYLHPQQNNNSNNGSTHTLTNLDNLSTTGAVGSTPNLHPHHPTSTPSPWYRPHAAPASLSNIPTLHLNGQSHLSPHLPPTSTTPRLAPHQNQRSHQNSTSPQQPVQQPAPPLPWSPPSLLPQLATYYTHQGDVQFLTTLSNLLYPRYRSAFTKRQVDDWTEGYISLLTRKNHWGVAAEVRKYTGSGVVRRKGQTETFVGGACGWCGRAILVNSGRGGGGGVGVGEGGTGETKRGGMRFCESCKRLQDGCVICRKGIAGRWVLCGVCGHGGHEGCLRRWFFGSGKKKRGRKGAGEGEDEDEDEDEGGIGEGEGEGKGGKEVHRGGWKTSWGGEVDGDEEEMEICPAVGCGHECLPRYVSG